MSENKHKEVIQAHVGEHTLLKKACPSAFVTWYLDVCCCRSLLFCRLHISQGQWHFHNSYLHSPHVCWLYRRNYGQKLQTILHWIRWSFKLWIKTSKEIKKGQNEEGSASGQIGSSMRYNQHYQCLVFFGCSLWSCLRWCQSLSPQISKYNNSE